MPQADELLAAGDIGGARKQLIEEVRANPGDIPVRMFLFQIFALLGEYERAKAQLETIAKLDPEARMLAVAYNQCMDAEEHRAKVFAGEEPAPILAKIEWGETLAKAIQARQQGAADADALYAEAFDAAPTSAGTTDAGIEFDWIADADPRFGPVTEAIIAGRYGLIPFSELESLTINEAQDLRDTIWTPAEFGIRQGARVAGFIPARYPGSDAADDPGVVRGTATVWAGDDHTGHYLGHRLFAFSDGSELPLQQLRKVEFRSD
ncbi:type VI secretion system accessory protein TagJ [Erythrobacter sp. JK5]|uniref:type VI secretion system accessory protein TagJ n=1 Tax=Erythrobacter sp. JK5 TaxID=2829500 RepID=UPI001BA55857|nr:type VI secretion system accessory protein TagJ [Erythrobacter sp. JK5]QUL36772.1 tetratricopeptide repeat protein [Erythrobacter sp. JK5]